jgi:hypothetical protein
MNRLHFQAIWAVEICLRGANMRMTHQRLDGSKIIPIIREGSDNLPPVLTRWKADGKRNFRQEETLNNYNYISVILQNGLPTEALA